jgi:hypothetical protein
VSRGFRSRQPYLNIAVAGALIGAILAYPRWGWVGAILGAIGGIASAATIILVLVGITWIVTRMFGKGERTEDR